MPPLRPRPRHPHHTLIVKTVILRRVAPPTSFRGQQWPDQCPFIVRYANSLARECLPKDSLQSTYESHVKLCPQNLMFLRSLFTRVLALSSGCSAAAVTANMPGLPICSTLNRIPDGFKAIGDCDRMSPMDNCTFTLKADGNHISYYVEPGVIKSKTYRQSTKKVRSDCVRSTRQNRQKSEFALLPG